ncbi:hypothetical protein OG203_35770 [Nocardia sp. NBC_01499]
MSRWNMNGPLVTAEMGQLGVADGVPRGGAEIQWDMVAGKCE